MSAGSFSWQWADGDKVKARPCSFMLVIIVEAERQTPQQLSAPKYMEKLLVWVRAQDTYGRFWPFGTKLLGRIPAR